MSGETNQLDLPALNEAFERQDPAQIVAWAAAQFGDDLVMSSSFGADSAVLLHMATRVAPKIRVIFADTGYIFPETHAFLEQLRQRLNLNIHIARSRNDPAEYLRRAGETDPTWRKDHDACCAANKNEPFQRAMRELRPRAWLRGIRRNQAATRADRKFIEWSDRYEVHAISPLLNWTDRNIYLYLTQHKLPYHPLREKGYLSIGCKPLSCTRPITLGEDPRSGRWAGQTKVECGINTDNSLDSANL
jgi:phosphoadenosine phosphosulfate reductase